MTPLCNKLITVHYYRVNKEKRRFSLSTIPRQCNCRQCNGQRCSDKLIIRVFLSNISRNFSVKTTLHGRHITKFICKIIPKPPRATHKRETERKREALTYSETQEREGTRWTGRGKRRGREKETGRAARKRERERERDGQYEQSETEERT